MKKKLFLFLVSIFFINSVNSQDFNSQVNNFSNTLKVVKSNKKEFTQSINIVQPGVLNITITEKDTKGKSTTKTFIFNPSDINKNEIKKVVKKDLIYIQIKTKNKYKLIKQSINDEKIGYVSNFKIYAEDINNAREIESALKNIIPIAKKITTERIHISSLNDYLSWLENNISNVDLLKSKISQTFSKTNEYVGSIVFTKEITTSKSSEENKYQFNLLTINPKSIKFTISGDQIGVQFETNNSSKLIKYSKDTNTKFVNKVVVLCKDVEQARDLKQILKHVIPLVEKEFNSSIKAISNTLSGIEKLNSLIGDIMLSEKKIIQHFKGDCIIDFKLEIEADKSETHNYNFSFSDINASKLKFNSKNDYLFIDLFTHGDEPFIKHIGNDDKSSYIKSLKIYSPSIEKTIIIKHTLQDIIKLCGGDEAKKETVINKTDTNANSDDDDNEEDSSERDSNCKPSKTAKLVDGGTIDLYGGKIRNGGFVSNDESVYTIYIGQVESGKKGTALVCILQEPVKNKKEYNDAVNNFLNDNNLKNSFVEITINGQIIKFKASKCTQSAGKFLGDISSYVVYFESDITKSQVEMLQKYDLKHFRLVIGGHPYERHFKKPTKRTAALKKAFNCVEMDNIFELKKKDATKMDLSEVAPSNFSTAINGKWVLQDSNGKVLHFMNGKVLFLRMGVQYNEGTYKIVGKRIIMTSNKGNSISEIGMFLKDMIILKEKGVEKTYERID